MARLRLLILLTGCFLIAAAARADELGYVDCATHPDNAQVFAKARQSQDVVESVPCGERFTVLLYGFIFSRVQTKDGKIGYVYSNVISADRAANSGQQQQSASTPSIQSASMREPVAATKPASSSRPSATASAAKPATITTAPQTADAQPTNPPAPAQPQPLAAQPAPVQTTDLPTQPAPAPVTPAVSDSQSASAASVQATTQSAPPQTASAPQPVTVQSAPAPSLPTAAQVEAATSASATQPVSSVSDSAPASAPASEPVPAQPVTAPASQPEPQPASAQPPAAQPEVAPVRNASVRSSWEKPMPGARQNRFLLDIFSGYSFARFANGGYGAWTNLNGAMGSVGWNMKPWLQVLGDSSYNFVTLSGTKYVIWGNHFGPRLFYRGRYTRWGITPFAEGLVGGSRLDTTISGGAKTSTNCISYKAGGGLDVPIGRRWLVRLIDVDYYRTSFAPPGYSSATQNNYWASAGVVLRLFGSAAE